MKIGILGFGFVGQAVAQLSEAFEVAIFDPFQENFCKEENQNAALTADFVYCCVPTSSSADGSLDLSIVEDCVAQFRNHPDARGTFVIKSTVTPGTTDNLCRLFSTNRILMNPEFLTQKTANEDFRNPSDVVIGGDPEQANQLKQMYSHYYRQLGHEVSFNLCTGIEAELAKVVRNSFYAVKVSFSNEVYELCQKLGISYDSFRQVLTNQGQHPWYHGQHTQVPGPDGRFGYGGKCLPKDSLDLATFGVEHGARLNVLEASIHANAKHRQKGTAKPAFKLHPLPFFNVATVTLGRGA